MKIFKGILGLSLWLVITLAGAKEVYYLNKEKSKLTISGTSSLHNWEMEANEFDGQVELNKVDESKSKLSNLVFKCTSKSILSDKKLMDKKAHDALKAEKNPEIILKLQEGVLEKNNNSIKGTINGKLFIAGTTRNVSFNYSGISLTPKEMKVTGIFKLKMSEFGIEAPTALMGAITTGDEITINYSLIFSVK